MGGEYRENIITASTEQDLQQEYEKLVEHHMYMYGHSGYSGSFAEKPELKIIPGVFVQETAGVDCRDTNDKWGPSFAYHIGEDQWYIGGWCSL